MVEADLAVGSEKAAAHHLDLSHLTVKRHLSRPGHLGRDVTSTSRASHTNWSWDVLQVTGARTDETHERRIDPDRAMRTHVEFIGNGDPFEAPGLTASVSTGRSTVT